MNLRSKPGIDFFKGFKLTTLEMVVIALLSALMIVLQVIISFLPNIELVSFLVIVYTLVLKRKVVYVITVFNIAEGMIYGIHTWWFSYLYIWAILAIAVSLLRFIKSPLAWAMISAVYGLMFGALCAIPYFLMGGLNAAVAYWVQGIQFDLTHCIGNFAICLVLFKPVYKLLSFLYAKLPRKKEAV